jgi:serine/threonine protein kinase
MLTPSLSCCVLAETGPSGFVSLDSLQVLCVSSVDAEGKLTVTAKISDFGLALRAMPLPNGRGWASVPTPPRGTPLYMAPELLKETDARGCVQVWTAAAMSCCVTDELHGSIARCTPSQLGRSCDCGCGCLAQVSQMSDVYSFGVLLAFLFTGNHSTAVASEVQVSHQSQGPPGAGVRCFRF